MWALPADVPERRGAVAVDLDPEHLDIGDRPQNLQITFSLGVEVQVEQQIDMRAGAVAYGFEVSAQVAQHRLVDVELGHERDPKPGAPAPRRAAVINEDVGFQLDETLLAHLGADRLYSVEARDGGLVQGRMIYPPGGAMRPIDPDTVSHLAAEQGMARDPERLRLSVEQRILD